MKRIFAILAILVAFCGLAFAAEDFSEGKRLVESKADCSQLSDGQLEAIGEYLMEQLHPGAAHERMDAMMGGEGSASLRNAHIQMAQVIYCGRTDVSLTYGGMMGMGMMGGYGLMSNGAGYPAAYGTSGYGMMGYGYPNLFGWSIFDMLLLILLLGLIVAVYLHIWSKVKKQKKVSR
jgi:hypothetical protein